MVDSIATTGIDNIPQTAGADTLTVSNTDQAAGFNQIQAEDFFDGGGGTDTIFIDNQDIDLEGVNTDSTTDSITMRASLSSTRMTFRKLRSMPSNSAAT